MARHISMKIPATIILLGLLGVSAYFWRQNAGEDQIFVLPKGYSGVVTVLFNREDGQPVKYEEGKRVYEIPQNGILKTQFTKNTGWHNPDKYFYTENGNIIDVPYVLDYKELKSNNYQVCCFSTGKAGKNTSGISVEFAQFYVGTKEEIDSAAEKNEKINPADLIERIK
jgi:hypothetical protein